ncbi:MAG: phosphate ABC transporter substrate-binding protein [Candidatus Methanomethylophilaceae archaeon]|nr:phosphate ABC transporter substrate-binding protein [Candidatus Methanomethylophilaceae archaeon]
MNENTKLILAVAVTAIVCIAGTYAAISGSDSDDSSGTTLSVAGSTTILPLMGLYQESYEKYTNVTLEVSGGGSGAGASAVINGTASFGMLSRDLKGSETDSGLKATVIAKDGVAVIVGANAGVTDLTLEQVAKIFSGEFTDWSEVGGTPGAIAVNIRESGSGTRDCFDTVMEGAYAAYDIPADTNEVGSTGAMVTAVNGNSTAIGYVSFGALGNLTTASAVSVGGVAATTENVVNETYTLQRSLILATMGDPSGAVLDFFNWILGPQGQQLAVKSGFIAVKSVTV